MNQQGQHIAQLEQTVVRLSLCVAALAGALADSSAPDTVQILQRWEARLGQLDINLAAN